MELGTITPFISHWLSSRMLQSTNRYQLSLWMELVTTQSIHQLVSPSRVSSYKIIGGSFSHSIKVVPMTVYTLELPEGVFVRGGVLRRCLWLCSVLIESLTEITLPACLLLAITIPCICQTILFYSHLCIFLLVYSSECYDHFDTTPPGITPPDSHTEPKS